MRTTAYQFDTWNGVPVVCNERLALRTLNVHMDSIEISFATWLLIKDNREALANAQAAATELGVRSFPYADRIPNHRVGAILRESLTILSEYSEGVVTKSQEPLRDEIAHLRRLLDESEAALDLANDLLAR